MMPDGPDPHRVAGQRDDDDQGRRQRAPVHAARHAGRRLPAAARRRRRRRPRSRSTSTCSQELDRQDALLDLDRRDARAPELGAVRVGRRRRAHGDDRRPSPVEDGGEGHRPAGVGDDAHPAQGHPGAAPPLRRHRRPRRGAAKEGARSRSCRSRRAARARSSRAAG